MSLPGSCACGAVRFEVTEPPVSASYCHCTRCQKRTGTAASAQAHLPDGAFRLVAGEEALGAWRPPGGFEKWFCRECGSQLFSRNPDDERQVGVRMSAFDADPGVRPGVRQFVASAAAWEPIPDDGLPRFPGPRE